MLTSTRKMPRIVTLLLLVMLGLGAVTLATGPDFLDLGEQGTTLNATERNDQGHHPVEGKQRRRSLATPEALGEGYYTLPAGQKLVFSLKARAESTIRRHKGQQGRLVYRFDGRLHLAILDRREDKILGRVTFPGLALEAEVNGMQVKAEKMVEFTETMALPTTVRMDQSGRILGLCFAPDADTETKNWVRAFLGAAEFVIPADADPCAWTLTQTDHGGDYRADYRWRQAPTAAQAGVLEKAKRVYLETPGQDQLPVPKVASASCAHMDTRLGWLTSVTVEEESEMGGSGTPFAASGSLKLACHLVDQQRVSIPDDLAELWAGPFVGMDARADCSARALAREADRFRKELAGVSANALIGELIDLVQSGRMTSHEFFEGHCKLTWLVKLRPESLAKLEPFLLDSASNQRLVNAVFTAIGAAQSIEAQAFLARYLSNDTLPESLRMEAAVGMATLKKPTPQVFQAVQGVLDNPRSQPSLKSRNLLVLGVLAGRQKGKEKEDTTMGLANLLGREPEANQGRQLANWLVALGNAGQPEVLPAASRYLKHGDERIRVAAVTAIRQLESAAATEVLIGCLRKDRSAEVRANIAEIISPRTSSRVLDTITKLLRTEKAEMVRRSAIVGLGRQMGASVRARSLLERVRATDPAKRLRDLAARILDPQHNA